MVIGGGGIMGCSSALFLAQRVQPSSICIVERDPKVSVEVYTHARVGQGCMYCAVQ